MPLPITGYFSNSNYYASDGSNENLSLFGVNAKVIPNTIFSIGIGSDCVINPNGESSNNPAIEAKLKYNINNNLNTQFRFRKIGGTEQYRVTFGGSHKFDKHNSIYAAVHATSKNNHGTWNHKTGGWIGYTYTFNNGVSLSGELQQNINLNGKPTQIGSFNDGNKLVNMMLTVPLN